MPDLLVLQIDAQEWAGVEAEVNRRSVRVRQGFRLTPPERAAAEPDASLAEWLKGELHRLAVRARHVHLVLPREELLVRRLDLPPVADAQLASVVRYQAAASSPSAEPVLLDFLPLPSRADESGRSVLTVAVDKDPVEKLRSLVHAAGMHLDGVTVSPVAIAELVVRAETRRGDDPLRPSLAVVRHGRRLEIDVIYRQRLCMTHAVEIEPDESQPGGRALAETQRLLVSGGSLLDGKRIGRAWILGAEKDDGLAAAIAQRMQCEVRTLDPFGSEVETSAGASPEAFSPSHAACAGALLLLGEPTVEPLDFLHPRQPPVPKDYRKVRWAAAAGAVAVLLAVVFGSIQLRKMSLDDRIASQQKELQELNEFLARGEPVLKATGELETWEGRKVEWAEELGRLGGLLDTRQLYFLELRVDPSAGASVARISATGVARQRRDVEELSQRLSDDGYRVFSPTYKPHEKDREFPLQFELNLELPVPPAAAVQPTAGAGRATTAQGGV